MSDFNAPLSLGAELLMDEALDVSLERVDKLDAPLLLIGLGGTGSDAVSTIKSTLARRFNLPKTADGKTIPVPPRTGYLVIDSDRNGKEAFDASEIVNIADGVKLSALLSESDHRHLSASQKEWVHHDLHTVGEGGPIGAGTYRAASRLMLDCKYTEVYNKIRSALKSLVTMAAGAAGVMGSAQIFIITGIGGGTGSGTFLDVAQIIRHMMRTEPDLHLNYTLSAYIVMPDLTISHLHSQGASEAMVNIVKHNSYAALKELDFWMNYSKHQTPYTMTYSNGTKIQWVAPFDHVTLMSDTNVNGQVFGDGYKLVQRTIAENLLHYMASEKTAVDGNGVATFSYLSYESNLHAQSQVCEPHMTLPLAHTYRAVGAYSKRIPKKKILYYEGRLLFKTFMPPRNDHGFFVPNDHLLQDGQSVQRLQKILGAGPQNLYTKFSGIAPYPGICGEFNGGDRRTVDSLRNSRPIHDSFKEKWQDTVVAPAAHDFAENYLQATWQRFIDWCREVMSDPAYGPFSLKQYLEDPNVSIIKFLADYTTKAEGHRDNMFNQISPSVSACRNLYTNFMNPPVIGGARAVQAYLDALKQLLGFARQYELYKQYARIMTLLKMRVEEYLRTALIPLCNLLDALSKDFSAPENNHDTLGSDLFEVSTMHGQINDIFSDANRESAVSRAFLGKLCESTFEAEKNVNVGTCGLTFTFLRHARQKALLIMKQEMDACFQSINGQSLNSIMTLQCQDSDPAVQSAKENQYITSLTNSVVNSAIPLFSLSATNATEITTNTAKEVYLSIPQDAVAFLDRLSPDDGNHRVTIGSASITPKASSLTDHIFCNITWDVLPLYSYSIMPSLKEAYDNTLANAPDTSAAKAIHLVNTGARDADYLHNWRLLPSPNPFYLFSPDAPCTYDEDEYEAVRKLVDRLLSCGMLTIDSTEEKPVQLPTYTFHVFRAEDGSAMHNSDVCSRLKALQAERDPITGAPLTPDQLLLKLSALLNAATSTFESAWKSPSVMKTRLHLNPVKSQIDPFQPGLSPDKQNEARSNYHRLVIEYAVHILLQKPALLRDVQYQIDSFEQIHQEMESIRRQANAWAPRIAYAETFARLFTYELIRFDMMGNPTYTDDTQTTRPLIQSTLFRDDLKDCRPIVKSVGAIADLDPNHAIRQTLEHRLRNLERDWDDRAIQSALTQKEVQEQIQRLEALEQRSKDEYRHYHAQKMNDVHADHALLDKYIALVSGVEHYAAHRLEILRQIHIPGDTWDCPNCGKKGIAGKFCPECGYSPVPKDTWDCVCGKKGLTGKFCPECGKTRVPEPVLTWDCVCGKKGLTGKFCPECGRPPQPVSAKKPWDCVCGKKGLTGKFCPECGRPPQDKPDTWNCVCGKTGLTGRFCPECGNPRP